MLSTGTNEGQGPKITPAVIEEHIASEHYFTALQGVIGETFMRGERAGDQPEALGLLTICVLVLENGYTVLGKSACASPSNFSQEIGNKVAREDAIRQIWPLLGYQLRDRLHAAATIGDSDVGEALTRMLAYSLGNQEVFRPGDANVILDCFPQDNSEEGAGGK